MSVYLVVTNFSVNELHLEYMFWTRSIGLRNHNHIIITLFGSPIG